MSDPQLVLGSGSPRRREILAQLGVPFEVVVSDVPEPERSPAQTPAEYARGLSASKALAVAARERGRFVLGADTVVVVDGDVLGKPRDVAEGRAMLARLSGRAHEVITAVSLVSPQGTTVTIHESTQVWFRPLDAEARARYAESGEGSDKAGGYAIQGLGAGLVSRVEGSYSNVVGLPAAQVLDLLLGAGVLSAWP